MLIVLADDMGFSDIGGYGWCGVIDRELVLAAQPVGRRRMVDPDFNSARPPAPSPRRG